VKQLQFHRTLSNLWSSSSSVASLETVQQFVSDHRKLLFGVAAAAVSAKAISWLSLYTPDKPINFPVSLDDQSIEIEASCFVTSRNVNFLVVVKEFLLEVRICSFRSQPTTAVSLKFIEAMAPCGVGD
jgi:hypothetical protein